MYSCISLLRRMILLFLSTLTTVPINKGLSYSGIPESWHTGSVKGDEDSKYEKGCKLASIEGTETEIKIEETK